ncbi:MAG: hypothetical protein ABDH31_07360 [Chlorobiota bacterium]
MRSIRWSLVVLVLVFSGLQAQLPQWQFVRSHNVLGKTPLMSFFDPSSPSFSPTYIICGGVDADFDGQQDQGDEPPSVTVIAEEGGEVRVVNTPLAWGPLSFPLRPAILPQRTGFALFLPRANRLVRVTYPPLGGPEDTLLSGPAQAVAVAKGAIFVSRRSTDDPTVGLVIVLRWDVDGVRVDTLRLGSCRNIQQFVWDEDRQQLIVLCEGQFGQRDAVVQFLPQGRDSGIAMVPVGGTGNYLLLSGDTLVVVSNGSHEVYLIDPGTRLWHRMPIELGTTGYGGPREAVLLTLPNGQRTLLVSTYSRDVRWVDINTGQILQTLQLTGMAEGMALRSRGDTLELWVAQPFTPTYGPDSTVAVFRLVLPTSVAEQAEGAGEPRLMPSFLTEGPVRLEWQLPNGASAVVRVEVYGADGRRHAEWELPAASGRLLVLLPLSRQLLPAGAHFLRLTSGPHTKTLPFVVY